MTGSQSVAPVLGHLLAGPGAATVPATAQIGPLYCSYYGGCTYGAYYRWNGLTLQPGQRLILMHFAVQESDPTAAQAAINRLEQLPPDALAGLTADDKAVVVNFRVP
jgi:hypothetical protein